MFKYFILNFYLVKEVLVNTLKHIYIITLMQQT
jgi:hypothetical protein